MTETAAAALLPIPVTQQQSGAPCPTVAATILSQRASLKAANLLVVNRATTHSRRRAGMGGEKTEDMCRCSFLYDTPPLRSTFFMRVQCLVKKIHLARRYNSDCDFQFSTTLQHQYKTSVIKKDPDTCQWESNCAECDKEKHKCWDGSWAWPDYDCKWVKECPPPIICPYETMKCE